jgi:PKD repeat protein
MFRLPRLRHRHNQRSLGQGLVEFALVLPVLMLIFLFALDFGRVFLGWVELNNAARIGANFAANHPDAWGTPGNATDVATYRTLMANDAAAINCVLPNPVPDPTFPDGSVVGGRSQLSLTCQFSVLTPFIGNITGNPITVGASAVFPIQHGDVAGITISAGTPPPLPNVPGAPLNVAAVAGNAQATVSWDPPTSDGGSVITGYRVSSSPGGLSCTTTGTQSCTVIGLTNGTAYTFTVTATNAAGTGPASTASSPVTPTGGGTLPVAAFYGTPTGAGSSGGGSGGTPIVGLPGVVVAFTNQSTGTGALTSAWTFGDGGTSANTNPSHTYNTLGTFDVKLTVTDSNGSTALTRTSYVLVGCQVPNFAGVKKNNASGLWTAAGFTGAITFLAGNGNYTIGTQSLGGGIVNPPPSGCADTITVGP